MKQRMSAQCSTCKHWDRDSETLDRESVPVNHACLKVVEVYYSDVATPAFLTGRYSDERPLLHTAPNFCCSLWEEEAGNEARQKY